MTYTKNEIMTATDMVRNFSSVLGILSKGEAKPIGIVKDNRFAGVMVTGGEYEK